MRVWISDFDTSGFWANAVIGFWMLWDSGIAAVIAIVIKRQIVGMLEPGGFRDWWFFGFVVEFQYLNMWLQFWAYALNFWC